MSSDLAALRPEIERIFRGAREPARRAFAEPPEPPRRKRDGTVVTPLDLELEERFATALLALDDSWGVRGEEGGHLSDGELVWHLDAIDGTLNYSRRIPEFVCQAALMDDHVPLLGVIYDPLRDELAWAARGQGAWMEGERLRVSDRPIEHALLLVDIARSGSFVTNPEVIPRVRRSVYRMRSFGCAGLHFLHVARGAADAFLGTRKWASPLHDLAPGTLFVREAGGRVTNLAGEDALRERKSVLAAHGDLHRALQEVVLGDPDLR